MREYEFYLDGHKYTDTASLNKNEIHSYAKDLISGDKVKYIDVLDEGILVARVYNTKRARNSMAE